MKTRLFLVLLFAPLTSQGALVAWYPLNEGSGSVVNDASGNGNTMTTGAPWLGTGAFGGSVQLGSASLLSRAGVGGTSLAGLNATTGNKISVSFWMKANAESQGSSVFYMGTSASGKGNRFLNAHVEWTDGNTYFDVGWDAANSGPRLVANLGTVSDALHHYVMTYDGDTGAMAIYKDGTLAGSGTSNTLATLPWASIQNFEIGALSFESFWPGGQVDDFAIFNTVLTEQQRNIARTQGIAALVTVPEPGTALFSMMALMVGMMLRRRRK